MSGWYGDKGYNDKSIGERRVQINKPKEEPKVDVNCSKTFQFTEEHIRGILAEYLATKYSINVDPSDFVMKITDSTTGGYMDNELIPAKLDGFSVTIPG